MSKLFSKIPAKWHKNKWREAFPAGNGLTGISVFGEIASETIILNRGDLWTGIKNNEIPDISESLKEMRELAQKKKYQEANNILCESLNQKNYSSKIGTITAW